MSESTPSVKPDKTSPATSTSTSALPSNIEWTPTDNQPVITAVSIDESQNPTNDDTAPNQGDDTSTVKPESVPNKLSIGYMSLYPLLCVVMNLAFVVMMMLDIRAFQRYNALCVGVWVFTIISVVYALAIGWIAINDDIKTRRNNTTDKNDKQINNPVETNADRHTADTATQNDTIIPVSDTVRVETVEKTIEEAVADNTDNVYVDNNNQPSNDKYPKGASKYDEPLIVDADNLTFDKTINNKQVLHPANKTPFELVEPTKETADKLSFPQKDTSDVINPVDPVDPKIMKMPHVPAVPAVIIKKHDEPMTQYVPNTASVHDDMGNAADDDSASKNNANTTTTQNGTNIPASDAVNTEVINNDWTAPDYRPAGVYSIDANSDNTIVTAATRAGEDHTGIEPMTHANTKTNQPQPASTDASDASDNRDNATPDAHDDDIIKRVESDPDIIAVEQRIATQTAPSKGRSREEIKDELAAKDADPASDSNNDDNNNNDDADTSDKQTPSVPDGPTYTFDVD